MTSDTTTHPVIDGPVQLVSCLIGLSHLLDVVSTAAAVGVLALTMPAGARGMKAMRVSLTRLRRFLDTRMGMLGSMLASMTTIKMAGAEAAERGLIEGVRVDELKDLMGLHRALA